MSEPEPVTFKLPSDAYRLIKEAHRLSAGAKAAITTAKPSQFREREVSCSPEIAAEIMTWFNDYEKHAELMKQFHWAVPVCIRTAERISGALIQHYKQ